MRSVRRLFLLAALLFSALGGMTACEFKLNSGGNGDGYGGTPARGERALLSSTQARDAGINGQRYYVVETYRLLQDGSFLFSRYEANPANLNEPGNALISEHLALQVSAAEIEELKRLVLQMDAEGKTGQNLVDRANPNTDEPACDLNDIQEISLDYEDVSFGIAMPRNCLDESEKGTTTYQLFKLVQSFYRRAQVPPVR